jgi:hypothetical protein
MYEWHYAVIASEAIQESQSGSGLLRRCAPRNDERVMPIENAAQGPGKAGDK